MQQIKNYREIKMKKMEQAISVLGKTEQIFDKLDAMHRRTVFMLFVDTVLKLVILFLIMSLRF